jgi:hypothetical protein
VKSLLSAPEVNIPSQSSRGRASRGPDYQMALSEATGSWAKIGALLKKRSPVHVISAPYDRRRQDGSVTNSEDRVGAI